MQSALSGLHKSGQTGLYAELVRERRGNEIGTPAVNSLGPCVTRLSWSRLGHCTTKREGLLLVKRWRRFHAVPLKNSWERRDLIVESAKAVLCPLLQ